MAKTPPNVFDDGDQQGKYNYNNQDTELKQVKEYLSKNNATATMVATALNIYRPNLTRYKTMLQNDGVLVVTHRDHCKETNYKADYLSCDPKKVKGVKNGG
jgi:adenine specific DNA methylase Mod